MTRILAILIAGVAAGPLLAEAGDAAKGEKDFRKCKSCHTIESPAGDVIMKGGRTGPNLYGVIGRQAGSVEGFNYSDAMVAAGEAGLVWDEETFEKFIQDPTGFLREYLDDSKARSKMTLKLRKGGPDVYAYLESVSE